MIQPTEEIIRALIGLNGIPQFDVFTDWLRDSLIRQSIENNHKMGDAAIKTAGGNVEIELILQHIDKAPAYLVNLKQGGIQ